jgi:hypothetical protein
MLAINRLNDIIIGIYSQPKVVIGAKIFKRMHSLFSNSPSLLEEVAEN